MAFLIRYTSALLALVRASLARPHLEGGRPHLEGARPHLEGDRPHLEGLDLVATAEELRERMRLRGVAESSATRTSLLQLFADTSLAESVLSEAPALNPGQQYAAPWEIASECV